MQNINGITNPQQNPFQPELPPEQTPQGTERNRPAKRFNDGRVVTVVYANPTHWGEIAWKVQQYRAEFYGGVERRHSGVYLEDLQHALRGLYKAKRWIKRTERRRRGSWFWWW